jgi:hypothetical protein
MIFFCSPIWRWSLGLSPTLTKLANLVENGENGEIHRRRYNMGHIFVWIFWNGGEIDIFRECSGGSLEKFRTGLGDSPENPERKRGEIPGFSGISTFLGPKRPFSRTNAS